MSTLKTSNIQHASAASAAITLDANGQATLNGLAYPTSGSLSGRNRIINGSMEIAQRGTSSSSNGYVSLDRWYVNQSGGSTTFSQETFTVGDEIEGIPTYAKLAVSSSSDFTGIRQRIEDVKSIPAGTVTVSFWAKGTAPAGGLKVWMQQGFGSGGSADVDIAAQDISLTATWTRHSINVTIPSISGKTVGSSSFLQVAIGQNTNTSTTAWELNITGVQLEAGSVATPFERRSYGQELALCRRYYRKNAEIIGTWVSSSTMRLLETFDTPMRVSPDLNVITTSAYHEYWSQVGYGTINSTVTTARVGTTFVDFTVLSATATGRGMNQFAMLQEDVIGYSAEL